MKVKKNHNDTLELVRENPYVHPNKATCQRGYFYNLRKNSVTKVIISSPDCPIFYATTNSILETLRDMRYGLRTRKGHKAKPKSNLSYYLQLSFMFCWKGNTVLYLTHLLMPTGHISITNVKYLTDIPLKTCP